jgi:putative transposase
MSDWPHSPVHRLSEAGAYMVTCGTYLKQPWFRGTERLHFLCDALLRLAAEYEWNLQAWAVFANHYHFVALSPPQPGTCPNS